MDGPVRQEDEGRDDQHRDDGSADDGWPALGVVAQGECRRLVRLHDAVGQQAAPGVHQQGQQHRDHQPSQTKSLD